MLLRYRGGDQVQTRGNSAETKGKPANRGGCLRTENKAERRHILTCKEYGGTRVAFGLYHVGPEHNAKCCLTIVNVFVHCLHWNMVVLPHNCFKDDLSCANNVHVCQEIAHQNRELPFRISVELMNCTNELLQLTTWRDYISNTSYRQLRIHS
jgi:hypothetical protein